MPSSNTDWVQSLSPWPQEFGLDRMRTLSAKCVPRVLVVYFLVSFQ